MHYKLRSYLAYLQAAARLVDYTRRIRAMPVKKILHHDGLTDTAERTVISRPSQLFYYKGCLLSKTIMLFCFNNEFNIESKFNCLKSMNASVHRIKQI